MEKHNNKTLYGRNKNGKPNHKSKNRDGTKTKKEQQTKEEKQEIYIYTYI